MKTKALYCLLTFSFCIVTSIGAQQDLFQSIQAANIKEFKNRLNHIESFDYDHKKTLLQVTKSQIEVAKEATKSLLTSKSDVLAVGLGVPVGLISALLLNSRIDNFKQRLYYDPVIFSLIMALNGVGFGLSFHLIYSGLTLSYAQSRLYNLKEIKKLIKNA
jgi:ABC-type sugar transport system permease subunit